MIIRLLSDLHLEFSDGKFDVPVLNTDSDTVLVLAGDIGIAVTPSSYKEFLLKVVSQFKHVIYIQGNHEHYKGTVERSLERINRRVGECTNFSIVENKVVTIDDVDFICATLWTDFGNGNPLGMLQAQGRINDYNLIRTTRNHGGYAGRKLRPEDTVVWHRESLSFIVDAITSAKSRSQKTVVVTHHAPSYQSISSHHRGDVTNIAYVSPLDVLIETLSPEIWVHGHVHTSSNYMIGNTNVIANPRGYDGFELNHEFDPYLMIEL